MDKTKILTGLVVVLALGLAFVLFGNKIHLNQDNNGYSVVYLSTGEIYVGKLKTFPDLELTNSYVLQVTKDATDPTKNSFQLQPISEALWAPKVLHLTQKNVVFYGPLLSTSKIAQTIAAQNK